MIRTTLRKGGKRNNILITLPYGLQMDEREDWGNEIMNVLKNYSAEELIHKDLVLEFYFAEKEEVGDDRPDYIQYDRLESISSKFLQSAVVGGVQQFYWIFLTHDLSILKVNYYTHLTQDEEQPNYCEVERDQIQIS